MPPQGIPAAGTVVLIIGYFDPLHAVHARRLQELRSGADTVVVAIDDPADALLSRSARAELVAALNTVDYVVTDMDAAKASLPHARQHDLRPEHDAYRNELALHVVRRQRGE